MAVGVKRRTWVLVGVAVLVAVIALLAAVAGGGDNRTESSSTADSTEVFGGAAPEVAAAPFPGASSRPAQDVPVLSTERSLVRTARLSIDMDDPVAGTRQVRAAVTVARGTVAEEESSDSGSRLTLRVPADSLDRLIDDIGALGRVTDRSGQVVDATDQVVDLGARVASQQASVVRVRALLAQATSIGDIVAIESELSQREADLDSLTSRLAALRDQVALSTLTVVISEPRTPLVTPPSSTGFLGGLASGWDGVQALASGLGAVIGFVLPFLPVLAVLLGILWLGRRVVRGRRAPVTASGTSE